MEILMLRVTGYGLSVRLRVRNMFFQEYVYGFGKRLKLRLRSTVLIQFQVLSYEEN